MKLVLVRKLKHGSIYLTGDARPRIFESSMSFARGVGRRVRSDDGRL